MIVIELIYLIASCVMIIVGIFLIFYDKHEGKKHPNYEAEAGICLGFITIVIFGVLLLVTLQIQFDFISMIKDFLSQEI